MRLQYGFAILLEGFFISEYFKIFPSIMPCIHTEWLYLLCIFSGTGFTDTYTGYNLEWCKF